MFFKCENLQKTGAFKARGACNAVLKAKEDLGNGLKGVNRVFAFRNSAFGSSRNLLLMLHVTFSGIVTHSSGNHGQAVAYASSIAALPSIVVVTQDTPQVKVRWRGSHATF